MRKEKIVCKVHFQEKMYIYIQALSREKLGKIRESVIMRIEKGIADKRLARIS